ncbi:MAG TPA: hypothetical protein VIO64_03885 [Pseudobacteroides sp.]|uniref:hypothetical protein n=1 Tax=Pseudobacteroides sp. TaxID=1968840 RepID=UPI002F9287AF
MAFYGCSGFEGQNITVVPDENQIFVIQSTPTARGKEYDDIIKLFRDGMQTLKNRFDHCSYLVHIYIVKLN